MFEERSLQSLVKEYHLTRESAEDMFRALFNLLMPRSIGFESIRQGIYGGISETRVGVRHPCYRNDMRLVNKPKEYARNISSRSITSQ